MEEVSVVVRLGHLLLGISWIGMLYYFNFVQGGFFKGNIGTKSKFSFYSDLAPSTLRWFRLVTAIMIATAIYLLWKSNNLFNDYIFFAALMSLCMALNVLFFIWPAQQIALGLKSGDRSDAVERAFSASRTNDLLCIPVCICLIASMLNGYSVEHVLPRVNTDVGAGLLLSFGFILALELNVIFGQRLMRSSAQAMAQASAAIVFVLTVALTFI